MRDKTRNAADAALLVKDGAQVVMSAGMQRAPMAIIRQLVRQGAKALRLAGVVGGAINLDFLVGAEVLRRGGPSKVITPMATLRHDKPHADQPGRLRLGSVHPPHTAAQVVQSTGFELCDPAELSGIPHTPEPTSEELHTLRTVIKPFMIETDTYGEWAAQYIGGA